VCGGGGGIGGVEEVMCVLKLFYYVHSACLCHVYAV